ncbi:MAG: NADH dehydrogenase subunit J [Candidatus Sericytochromatia bacterium]|nr:MAG: NADH dehydrogenase subunit J [Candidatus Sericytochromatia bacterium]
MIANTIFFWIFSLIAVISALFMITRKHPLSSALCLVITFIALSGLYGLLSAKLLFVIQILVYAGAIMSLIIFSIMLLNVKEENLPKEDNIKKRVIFSSLLLLPMFFIIYLSIELYETYYFQDISSDFGSIKSLGLFLFTKYTLPFEIVSILLLIALLGVVVLAKRKI